MVVACVSPADLFKAAGLSPCLQPVRWGTAVPERGPGVYVVLRAGRAALRGQRILYVGRTQRSLRQRVKEFYKHRYGDPRPHRGGQEVIPFKRDLWVYWAATDNSVRAEHLMIERFRELVDRMPYANRVRASRQSSRTRKQKRIVSA